MGTQEIEELYAVLGLDATATTDEELRTTFKKLALEWHPDRGRHDTQVANERFAEINSAYRRIMRDRRRKARAGPATSSPSVSPSPSNFSADDKKSSDLSSENGSSSSSKIPLSTKTSTPHSKKDEERIERPPSVLKRRPREKLARQDARKLKRPSSAPETGKDSVPWFPRQKRRATSKMDDTQRRARPTARAESASSSPRAASSSAKSPQPSRRNDSPSRSDRRRRERQGSPVPNASDSLPGRPSRDNSPVPSVKFTFHPLSSSSSSASSRQSSRSSSPSPFVKSAASSTTSFFKSPPPSKQDLPPQEETILNTDTQSTTKDESNSSSPGSETSTLLVEPNKEDQDASSLSSHISDANLAGETRPPPGRPDPPLLEEYTNLSSFFLSREWIYHLSFPLETLHKGTHLSYRILRKSLSGRVRPIILDMVIPPGCHHGTKIVFKQTGHERRDGTRQDIVFLIMEERHERFMRVRDDLVLDVRLPWVEEWDAHLEGDDEGADGGKGEVHVEGVDGEDLVFEVEYGRDKAAAGLYTFYHAGMQRMDGEGRGKLNVRWEIVFPSQSKWTALKQVFKFRA